MTATPTTRRTWPGSKELLLILLFWTLLAAVSALNRQLDRPAGMVHAAARAPVILAFTEAYAWALMTPLVFWVTSRYGVDRSNWGGRAFLYLALGVACALLADAVLDLVRDQILPARRPIGQRGFRPGGGMVMHGRGASPFWFINELMIYMGVVAAGIARDYVYRERARREEAAALEVQLSRARLDALQAQLNPHFLFNTLHAVSALVERDPAGVRRMIARLSELLRYTLDQSERAEVRLESELAFIRGYLEIMKIRFQGRLEVDWEIEPGVERALVPPLVLQPIVENAIKHGVSQVDGTGMIAISARRTEDLFLVVRNSGGELPPESPEQPSGLGLKNTRERLRQMYGDAASFTLASIEAGGTEATIRLPYRDRERDA